jgi:hypothetical protein
MPEHIAKNSTPVETMTARPKRRKTPVHDESISRETNSREVYSKSSCIPHHRQWDTEQEEVQMADVATTPQVNPEHITERQVGRPIPPLPVTAVSQRMRRQHAH